MRNPKLGALFRRPESEMLLEMNLTALSYPLDKQGISTSATIHANLGTAALVEQALRRRRGTPHEGRRAAGRYRQVHRAQREGQVRRPRCHDRGHDQLGRDQPADDARALGQSEGGLPGRAEGSGRALRRRSVRRQPARIPRERARGHPDWPGTVCSSAPCWCVPTADELASFVPEYTILNLPSFKADPARHGCRSETRDRGQPDREADPDRRHGIFGRDEEGRVRPAELPPAGAGRDADALFGQHRRRRQERDLLRPVGHRQDDAVGRRQPHADRR